MRWPWRYVSAPKIRQLGCADYQAALELMRQSPYETILMREQLEQLPAGRSSQYFLGSFVSSSQSSQSSQSVVCVGSSQSAHSGDPAWQLTAVCWVGANIIPWGFDEAGLDALAMRLRHSRLTANSFVGDAGQVLGLWSRLSSHFREPREIRSPQLSMVYQGKNHGSVCPDMSVQLADPSSFDLIFPASVAMFTEEVGYDPSQPGDYYAQRVRSFLENQRTYARFGSDFSGQTRVEFKADIGVLTSDLVQIQGVWVPPDMRGQGIAARGLCAVAEDIRERLGAGVHLYVNDYNLPAVRSYEKAGFATIGEYATIII